MTTLAPLEGRLAPTGMVASISHLASSAGLEVLGRGGSAVDAALASGAVLAVIAPHRCGVGGDLFALVHSDAGPPVCLNASGRAGSGADAARLRAEGTARMPYRRDIRSVPVPGCVDGWLTLHQRFGRVPIEELLAPAIRYAEEGFPASGLLVAAVEEFGLAGVGDLGHPRPAALVRRPRTGRALRAIAEEGRAGFYEGEFGQGLVELGDGEYAWDDLLRPNADWVEPLGCSLWDRQVWTTPPSSQGYLTLASCKILRSLELPPDPDDPTWAHLLVEAARQAGFDRLDVLFEGADGEALIANERLAPRAAAIRPEHASSLGAPSSNGDTTTICVVDGERIGVSLIQSNAADFGSHLVEPRTGTFLHNRGVGFSLVPGHPTEYAPNRRPPHTLAPALVTDATGALTAVIATMGGDSQPQILLQLLVRLLSRGEDVAQAVAAGRFGLRGAGGGGLHTWEERGEVVVDIEGHAPEAWESGLRRLGHHIERVEAFSPRFGQAHAVLVGDDGMLTGVADPRAGQGAAIGY